MQDREFHFRLSVELDEGLRQISLAKGCNKADVLRDLIMREYKQLKKRGLIKKM